MSELQRVDHGLTSVPRPPSAVDGVRLELKPEGSAPGFVDGAWWPRSRDLRHELPDLVARLAGRVGQVERVAFGRQVWDPTGRARLVTPGGRVAFDGFGSFEPDTVWFVVGGRRGARLCVVVIPPETASAEAAAVLRRASASDNVQSPADLLRGTDEGGLSETPLGGAAAGAAG
jgi:hypothetical protein